MAPQDRAPSAPSPETTSMLRQLEDEALQLAQPGPVVAGLLLIMSAGHYADPLRAGLPGTLLLVIPLASSGLYRWHRRAAAWLLISGCLAADMLVASSTESTAAICLLALPVGLAALFAGPRGGALTAVISVAWLLLAPASLLPTGWELRTIATLEVLGVWWLIWLTLRPLATALEWSWSSYEQSRERLEEARDYQVQFKQTLADLADANLQLTRLNRLVDGLRRTAEEALQAKKQFVANVSHELRTPLNMIVGFSDIILQAPQTYGEQVPPALLADLAVIRRNSQHLASLIDDVLDLSQIEAGQMALTKERVSLAEIVESALTAVRPLFESKGLYLEASVPDELTVYCDRTRIREVLLNLLSNAGRLTEQGGVHIRAQCERSDVIVAVNDTGPGIAAEDRGRIFQPFEQLDGSIRRRYGGSGLGLSISRSFVELHGGKMWLESEPGYGTTFYFRLPLNSPVPVDASVSRWFSPHSTYVERSRRSQAPHLVVRPRYVVLERGNSLQRLLRRYLGETETQAVASMEEARQELARKPALALLVNELSPGDALQRLNQDLRLPYGTPAILCSVPGVSEAVGALGVSDYLVKPVSRDALIRTFERLNLRKCTVLVVDDEPEAPRLFRRMLLAAEPGYRKVRASDGRQALDILRHQRPDVILLDLMMPEMDGFQFLATKSEDPDLRDIPVVVISARDPSGQPIVSNALAATREGGLSMSQILECIQALSRILAPASQPGGPTSPATAAG